MESASRPHPTRSLMILSLAALAFALGQTTLIPALTELQHELSTDAAGVAWTLTGYLVAAAVCTPIAGRLGDMFGKRRLLVVSLGLFVAGSVVSALGTSLEVVVAGRVLQGFGGGVFPLSFGIIRDEFPRDRVPGSIGLLSAIAGIGGGAGLILGGLIVDSTSYHAIFYVGAIMGAVALVAAELLIPESPNRTPARVDLRGAAVLAAGLVLVLVAVSQANDWDWGSAKVLGMIAAGFAVLLAFGALERRTRDPLANLETLAKPPVLMTNVATLLVGFGMFGSFFLVPQLAQLPERHGGFGLDALDSGLLLLPSSVAMLLIGPLSGVLAQKLGPKVPLALGSFIASAGLAFLGLEHGSQGLVLIGACIMGIGIGFAFAAMPNLIVAAVPMRETGEATGFNALVRSVGSSLGTQVTAAVLAGSAVAGSTIPTDDGFTKGFLAGAAVAVVAGVAACFIPRAEEHREPRTHLADAGAAAPLPEPAFAEER